MKLFICLATLLVASACAETAKKSAEKVPLEKKLDKRGLLELGYGYGHSGLDVGYLGHGSISHGHGYGHSGNAIIAHSAPAVGYYGHSGFAGLGGGHGGGYVVSGGHGVPQEFLISKMADVHKTITITKGIPVPHVVDRPYPVEHIRHVPVQVKVPVPQPYEVIKKVAVPVKEYVKVPVHVPQPYEVIKKVEVPVHVPVDRPYPVKVPVPQPYEVIKHVQVPVKVSVMFPLNTVEQE
ncbi:uncharacterized protein LOC111682928 [Lucilia cuprina]|uniref:uncharacterized protein LOC111682928 n=1 Tax=Lucilia cuprina TaxID=7375 RepID=UPI001F06B8EB|nr:uncharacterized protein LOC111682928 [Lucilia cuprina]